MCEWMSLPNAGLVLLVVVAISILAAFAFTVVLRASLGSNESYAYVFLHSPDGALRGTVYRGARVRMPCARVVPVSTTSGGESPVMLNISCRCDTPTPQATWLGFTAPVTPVVFNDCTELEWEEENVSRMAVLSGVEFFEVALPAFVLQTRQSTDGNGAGVTIKPHEAVESWKYYEWDGTTVAFRRRYDLTAGAIG